MAQDFANNNVLATMLSSYVNQYPATMLKIGNNYYAYPGNYTAGGFWFVAVDLTSLKVVQSIATTDTLRACPITNCPACPSTVACANPWISL